MGTIKYFFGLRAFWIGNALRLLLLLVCLQNPAQNNFLPFFQATLGQPLFDPWTAYLLAKGDVSSFPYGYTMWLVFNPLFLLQKFLDIDIILPSYLIYQRLHLNGLNIHTYENAGSIFSIAYVGLLSASRMFEPTVNVN